MKLRRPVLIASAIAIAAGTACEVFIGDGVSQLPDADAGGDSSDAGAADATGTNTLDGTIFCSSSQPPSVPPDYDGGAEYSYVMALRTLDLNPPITGFDLDDTCTCCKGCPTTIPTGPSCIPPDATIMPTQCDNNGGVDSKINDLVKQVTAGLPAHFLQASSNIATCGQRTVLIGLTHYNGQANDDAVGVVATSSYGLRDSHGDAGEIDASALSCTNNLGVPVYPPKWDGTDYWSVASATTDGDGIPISKPIPGFVKNWQLVADGRAGSALGGISMTFSIFGPTPVELGSPIVMGTLVPLDENGRPLPRDSFYADARTHVPAMFAISNGVAAGRAARNDLLQSLAFSTSDGVTPNCTDKTNFPEAKVILCTSADTAFYAELDNMHAPCDSLSAVIGFSAGPARASALTLDEAGIPVPKGCTPDDLTCDSTAVDAGTDAAADAGGD
jgi:hypothetical protein